MTCRFCLCFDGSQQGDDDDDVDEWADGEDIMMTDNDDASKRAMCL